MPISQDSDATQDEGKVRAEDCMKLLLERFPHVQALALSPDQVPPNISLLVEAVKPDGSRAPMIRLNTRPDWDRRYWFQQPLTLPRGTKVEVTARLEDPDVLSAAFSAAAPAKTAPAVSTVRLALNVVPAHSKPAAP